MTLQLITAKSGPPRVLSLAQRAVMECFREVNTAEGLRGKVFALFQHVL